MVCRLAELRPTTVKKTPKNMDSNSATRTSRLPRKTVLTIAPAESREMDFEEADEESTESRSFRRIDLPKTITPNSAMSISCDLMVGALQVRSFSSPDFESGAFELKLDRLLDDLEENLGASIDGSNGILRLQSLLDQLNRGEVCVREHSAAEADEVAKSILINAIHAVVSSQCQRSRFEEAVEKVSQRAIYQFAYGLTHEINNPLANIAARAQQLICEAASDADRRSLATIVDQAMRAHEMLAEMMRVVQPNSIRPRAEDVVEIVRQAHQIQEKQWTHAQVQCNLRLPTKPLFVSIDKSSLLEAICSLLQNAFQVCRPNDRIEIVCEELSANHPEYGPGHTSKNVQQTVNPRIRIAVRDTGPGLSSDAVACAWDLYFSGRENGRGLGISLAKVRQTVDAHGGLVWIQSKPNAGCTVEIRLPKLHEPPSLRKSFSI